MRGLLLFIINEPVIFCSHRLPVALRARAEGYEVHVATGPGTAVPSILKAGLVHHALPLSRSGSNPFRELITFLTILRLINSLRPNLVHLVTIKPVIYGAIAARLLRVPGVVAAVAGLGYAFIDGGEKRKLIKWIVLRLYTLAFGKKNLKVIFQNPDDQAVLVDARALDRRKAVMISGSGVDLTIYSPVPEPEGDPVVILAARLLWDKGVGEFVEAARLLVARGIRARFALVGTPDLGNPASVSDETLSKWVAERLVEHWGFREDMPSVFATAHIVVLPSYREGLPRVLVEAAACGRPIVTTNVPGCRDAIVANESGLLVPPHDSVALANAIQMLIENPELRATMGRAGRKLAERMFSVGSVVDAHLAVYKSLHCDVPNVAED